MPVGRTLGSLDLYDILTDLIPGTLVVAAAMLLFPPLPESLGGTELLLVWVLFGGYVTGHFLRFARDLGPPETDFQDRLKAGNLVLDEKARGFIRDQFDLKPGGGDSESLFEDLPDRDVMPLVLSYLETRPAARALRMQSMYSFYRSVYSATWAVVGIAIVSLGVKAVRDSLVAPWAAVILLLSIGAVGVPVFAKRREKFKERFVSYAVIDFYMDAVTNPSE